MSQDTKKSSSCQICKNICLNPFVLPCGNEICKEHINQTASLELTTNTVVDTKLKCYCCNDVHDLSVANG